MDIRVISQMMELQASIDSLDAANKDFLTAYYYNKLGIKRKGIRLFASPEPKLSAEQKILVEKLKEQAKSKGINEDVASFIENKTNGTMPEKVSDFFTPYRQSVCLIIGEYFADSFYIYLDRLPHLAVTGPMRTSNLYAYLDRAVYTLSHIQDFFLSDMDISDFIRNPESEKTLIPGRGTIPLLTAEIERGVPDTVGFISDTLTGGENAGQISNILIEAVLRAGNRELHKQLGMLLLAARLQEGLRAAILNTAVCGCPEAFLHLIGVVHDNNLIRYSSVKKAVSMWLGLGVERAKSDRVYTKLFALAKEYIIDSDARQKAAQSSDSLEICAGLWAIAFYDAREMAQTVRGILSSGDRHRMKVTAYYLLNTRLYRLRAEAAKTVLTMYPDDLELCAAYDCFFFRPMLGKYDSVFKMHFYDYDYPFDTNPTLEDFFEDKAEALRFYHIYARLVEKLPAESLTAEASGVEWYAVTIQRQHLLCKMLCILDMAEEEDLTDDYLKYWSLMSPEMRANTVDLLLKEPKTTVQWTTIISALGDKARLPREAAFSYLKEFSISRENLLKVEGYLKLKSGDLRQKVLFLLKKQQRKELLNTLERLMGSTSREIRQGGLSLAMEIKQDNKLSDIHEKSEALVAAFSGVTHTEKTLAKQIKAVRGSDAITETVENAFMLVADPKSRPVLPPFKLDFDLKDVFPIPWEKLPEIYAELARLIEKHADFEYRNREGKTVLLGNGVELLWQSDGFADIGNLPLSEVWRAFYDEHIKDPRVLFQIYLFGRIPHYDNRIDVFERGLKRAFGLSLFEIKQKIKLDKYTGYMGASIIFHSLYRSYGLWKDEFMTTVKLCAHIWNSFSPDERWQYSDKHYKKMQASVFDYEYVPVSPQMTMDWKTTEGFKAAFLLRYAIHLEWLDKESDREYCFTMAELAKAVNLELVPYDELILEMTCRKGAQEHLKNAFDCLLGKREARYDKKDYETLQTAVDIVMNKYVDMEIVRGDNDTPATPFITHIGKMPGIPKLIAVLSAIGDAPILRSIHYDYFRGSLTGRMESLSRLLLASCPNDGDTSVMLAEALKDSGISEKRLVELSMYNEKWTKLIAEYLNWDGFESGCWYFRAHMNEWFNPADVVEIEKYTPISVYELRMGAFDVDWFRKVLNTLGEERFAVLYDSSKYTTEGAKHARARKFADASGGKLNILETQKQVSEKRNKDLLLAYTLIPLKDKNDLLDRYLFLQKFAKESRQFGKQRQESEAETVRIAMGNLARTAGYSDVTRLTWAMETRTIDKIRPFFTPQKIEDTELYIHVDEDGVPSIVCTKDGKELKNVPAKLKKNETAAEILKLCKTLNEQRKRARAMLENAMIGEALFEVAELSELCGNPVVFPLIKNLVFRKGDLLGYFNDGGLKDASGNVVALDSTDTLVIAHPVDLYKSGNWNAWQQDLFKCQVRQPFKQVFRELYLKLPEEMDCYETHRYEGNQIQQNRAYSLLKSRHWSEAGHDSMQKVFYRQETFVEIRISDDWGTPADIEPPSLCSIEFYAHDGKRRKPIAEISEIVFSEVMRDADLVVSVAHAGMIDPQFSHSTIEMRSVIASCTLDLLGIKNVRLEGSHAYIDGKLAQYNIHLGSGVVHQKGGSMISVLPVYSQQQGRLFLPFIDDDPKTAEILSKLLLFADDSKIKDPSILRQVH